MSSAALDAAIGRAVRQGHLLTWTEDSKTGLVRVRIEATAAARTVLDELQGLLPLGVAIIVEDVQKAGM